MNNSAINLAINSNIGFTLLKWRSRRCPGVWITDIDYADIITVAADIVDDSVHRIEEKSNIIGLQINTAKIGYMLIDQKHLCRD